VLCKFKLEITQAQLEAGWAMENQIVDTIPCIKIDHLSGAIARNSSMYLIADYTTGLLSFHAGRSTPITAGHAKCYDET
jgi:hypothetical protein